MMSWMAGFPDGVQVAVTLPLFGEFVTPTVTGPERGPSATLTHNVWLDEGPQLEFACALPARRKSDPVASSATRRCVHIRR
jgi:hypothetical protein